METIVLFSAAALVAVICFIADRSCDRSDLWRRSLMPRCFRPPSLRCQSRTGRLESVASV